MCRNIFTMFAGYCGHAEKINSYNWTFQGNRNADMALSENEFGNLPQCSRMSESRHYVCV